MEKVGTRSGPLGRMKASLFGAVREPLPGLHAAMLRFSSFGPYRGAFVSDLVDAVQRLEAGEESSVMLDVLARRLKELADAGEFDRWLNVPVTRKEEKALSTCRDFAPNRRWRLQVYRMPPGATHAPHAHFNLASFLLIIRGSVHMREYDRTGVEDADHIGLRPVFDGVVRAGSWTTSTQHSRNVHWFGAVEEETVALNLNLRGWEPVTGEDPDARTGRRYIDPTVAPSGDGTLLARRIALDESRALFEGVPMARFGAPGPGYV